MAERNLEISIGICQVLCVLFNVQSSLHDNIVFSVCAHMDNATYIMFIMWNSIFGLDAWYHFRLNISCGRGGGQNKFGVESQFLRSSSLLRHPHFDFVFIFEVDLHF